MLVPIKWLSPRPGCARRPKTTRLVFRSFFSTSRWTSPLAVSNEITHLKSTFQAYATRIEAGSIAGQQHPIIATSMKRDVISGFLAHIQEIEPRTRRASHAMYAWRLRSGASPESDSDAPRMVLSGSSNGGEAGAGDRLERLLELGGCEGVILVVFRWYGGVKLGSDRWRCISSVGKEALERGGFLSGRRNDGTPGRKRRK